MRNLYVTAKEDDEPLSPSEITDRLKALFDNLVVDKEAAAGMCMDQVQRYKKYFREKGWSLGVIEDKWKDAVVIDGWNNDAENEKFQAILRNNNCFMLHFYEKLTWPTRRRIAKRIAEAIGYDFGLGEEV